MRNHLAPPIRPFELRSDPPSYSMERLEYEEDEEFQNESSLGLTEIMPVLDDVTPLDQELKYFKQCLISNEDAEIDAILRERAGGLVEESLLFIYVAVNYLDRPSFEALLRG